MTEKKIPIQDGDSEESGSDSESGSTEEQQDLSDSTIGGTSNGILDELAAEREASEQGGGANEDELASKRSGRDADFSFFNRKSDKGADDSAQGSSGNSEPGASTEQVRELQEKYLRALADFDNYKKRAVKERSDLLKYQGERVFIDLLEVIDNFDRALEASSNYELSEDGKQLQEGISLIHRQFLQVLEKWQVKGESALGEPFDPNKHEAISQMPSDDFPSGSVMNELEKAFYYKDKLLRPAKVVVATGPAAAKAEGGDSGAPQE
ncbi:MAG: nucleotide exchange factor GrpE [Bdellovibrionales bacterium]|nr:nucleotide exchange factor GrpE [Bdellovibrionales bacterium]